MEVLPILSNSQLGQRNGHALTVEVFDGCVDGLVERGDVGEGLMGEVMGLEVAPDRPRCR